MVQETRPALDPTIDESPLLKTQVQEPLPAPTGTLAREAQPTTTVQPAVQPVQEAAAAQAPAPTAQPAVAQPAAQPAPQPGAPVTAPVTEARPEQTVQGQLQGLLAQESPYITQARARAEQEAQRRGLRSSTLAVQAGEQAAISQALPIAQIDAQFNQRLAELGIGFEQSVALENLSTDNKERLLRVSAEIDNNSRSEDEARNLRGAYINGVSTLNTQYQEIVNNIQNNPDIRNKEEALSIAQAQFEDGVNLLNASFSSMPGWQADWAVVSGGIGATGTPAPAEGGAGGTEQGGVETAITTEQRNEVTQIVSELQQQLNEDVALDAVTRDADSRLRQSGATIAQAIEVYSSIMPRADAEARAQRLFG